MSITVTNFDDVMKQFARLENPNEVITEARKNLRAVVRKYQPLYKSITPEGQTGDAKRSIKVQSRSRRGVTTVRLVWGVPYIGIVNFKKGNKSEKFATMKWNSMKAKLDFEGEQAINKAVIETAQKHGVKIK